MKPDKNVDRYLQYLSFSDACYVREKYGDLVAPIDAPDDFWDTNRCTGVSAKVVAWIGGDNERQSLWNTESARIYNHTIEQIAYSGAERWRQKMYVPGGIQYHYGLFFRL